jgi:hypothetical protein
MFSRVEKRENKKIDYLAMLVGLEKNKNLFI